MADDALIVLNSEAIAKALRDADRQMLAPIQQAVAKWQLAQIGPLSRYPSPPPESGYGRTGTLGRTWASAEPTWTASSGGFESKLGNSTPYGVYVQGQPGKKPGQAKVHQGRWRPAEETAQKGRPELERRVQAAVAQAEQEINGVAS